MDVYPPPPYPTYVHPYPTSIPFGYLPIPTSPQNYAQPPPPPYHQPTLLYDSYPYGGVTTQNLEVMRTQPPVPPPHYTVYSPLPYFGYAPQQEEYLPQEVLTEKMKVMWKVLNRYRISPAHFLPSH